MFFQAADASEDASADAAADINISRHKNWTDPMTRNIENYDFKVVLLCIVPMLTASKVCLFS